MLVLAPRIIVDDTVCFGKPIIQGTRVPVAIVVGELAAGETMESIMEEYGLEREDILAALAYAASVLQDETIRPGK